MASFVQVDSAGTERVGTHGGFIETALPRQPHGGFIETALPGRFCGGFIETALPW